MLHNKPHLCHQPKMMISKADYTIGIYGIQDVNNSGTPTLSHDHGITIMKDGKVEYNIQYTCVTHAFKYII